MGIKNYLVQLLLILITVLGSIFSSNADTLDPSINPIQQEDSLYYDGFLHYRLKNYDSALKYARLSYPQALAKGDIELSIKSLNALGYCHYSMFAYDSALYFYKMGAARSNVVGNELRQMYFHNSIGIVYDDIGRYDSALANFYSSLELARKLEKEKDISIALTNIGNVHLAIGNLESAIGLYLESIEIKERNNFSGLDLVYYNTGLCYNDMGNYAAALDYFQKVLDLCQGKNCSETYQVKGVLGLGIALLSLKDYERAEVYLKQVTVADDSPTQISAYRNLAKLSSATGKFEEALAYIEKSNALARSIKSAEVIKNNYLVQASIYNDMKRPDSALYFFQLHHALKDSLFNETVAKNIQDLFVGLERKQADAEIRAKEREIAARKRANFLLALVILLTISLIIKFIMDLSKRKRINKYLDRQIALKTSELTRANRDLSEKTNDLDRLIYNISHEIRGPLARLLGLINIGKLDSGQHPETVKYYNELQNEATDLEKILKRMIIINNLNKHKVIRTRVDPGEFFKRLVSNSRYMWQDKIEIGLNLDGVRELNTDADLLEMALQNIIDNAARFRNPYPGMSSRLEIRLTKTNDGRIDIIFEDNGVGFDAKYKDFVTDLFFVASEKGGSGMGLHHTKLALNKIGAELEVRSTKNPTMFVVHL